MALGGGLFDARAVWRATPALSRFRPGRAKRAGATVRRDG